MNRRSMLAALSAGLSGMTAIARGIGIGAAVSSVIKPPEKSVLKIRYLADGYCAKVSGSEISKRKFHDAWKSFFYEEKWYDRATNEAIRDSIDVIQTTDVHQYQVNAQICQAAFDHAIKHCGVEVAIVDDRQQFCDCHKISIELNGGPTCCNGPYTLTIM